MIRRIFYSFHFKTDVMRVQQIRNIWVLEDNKPITPNKWEEIKNWWDTTIKNWIDKKIAYSSCVVVLIWESTHDSKWVEYEIKKAWKEKKGLVWIRIHNMKDPRTWMSKMWKNPFEDFTIDGKKLSSIVKTYNPWIDTYDWISKNIDAAVNEAINIRQKYG